MPIVIGEFQCTLVYTRFLSDEDTSRVEGVLVAELCELSDWHPAGANLIVDLAGSVRHEYGFPHTLALMFAFTSQVSAGRRDYVN